MTRAHVTTDHARIKSWVESRGGHPAVVTEVGRQSLLRIDFDPPDQKLKPVDWDTFFTTFERKSLAFLYQDRTNNGQPSRISKFIERYSTEAADLSQVPDDEAENSEQAAITSRSPNEPSAENRKRGRKVKSG